VVVGALAALLVVGQGQPWAATDELLTAVLAIVAVALAAELSSVAVNVGTATMSISFIPFLAAVFLFGQLWAMVIGGATSIAVEGLIRRKPWFKVAFNASKEVLALGMAGSAYVLLGGSPSILDVRLALVPVLAAGVMYSATSSLSVNGAIALSEGLGFSQAWSRLFAGSVLYDLLALPLPAFLAYVYGERQTLGLVAVIIPLFVVRHIYVQNLKLEQSSRDLLDLMVKAIEARDPYTSGHSQRVKQYARIIAKEAGLSGRVVEQIATAALLHDVGKIYEEYAPLLRKEGKLSPEETRLLRSHPARSAELVATISTLRGAVTNSVRHHHENYDGTGYPDGLAGDKIPFGARIIMLADTLDAMTTDRPYRRALPFERVIDEVHRHSGSQFDPYLAEIVTRSAALRRLLTSPLAYPLMRPQSGEIMVPPKDLRAAV
jgi:HD-GYP domain-containing protein (c-di-GMP phosphodiesterase class II)